MIMVKTTLPFISQVEVFIPILLNLVENITSPT